MRKLIFILIGIIGILILCTRTTNKEKEIRVRIIPNSNTKEDYLVKEKIKNIVLCYLEMVYDDSYDVCFENIKKSYRELEKELEKEYKSISISFNEHTLYNKTYNDNAIKNIKAYTLYIIIGRGAGDNWWGSIYPKFLSVSGDTEIQYESILGNVVKKIKEK